MEFIWCAGKPKSGNIMNVDFRLQRVDIIIIIIIIIIIRKFT